MPALPRHAFSLSIQIFACFCHVFTTFVSLSLQLLCGVVHVLIYTCPTLNAASKNQFEEGKEHFIPCLFLLQTTNCKLLISFSNLLSCGLYRLKRLWISLYACQFARTHRIIDNWNCSRLDFWAKFAHIY